MKYILFFLSILQLFFNSCTSYHKVQIRKKEYTYSTALPKGEKHEHIFNEEFDLHTFNYHDGASVFIVEGDPDAIFTGREPVREMMDSIKNYKQEMAENEFNRVFFNDQKNVPSSKDVSGIKENCHWRCIMTNDFIMGYYGVKEPNVYNKTLLSLKKDKNISKKKYLRYEFLDEFYVSDISNDFHMIDSINSENSIDEILKIFTPKSNGKYHVIRYIARDYDFVDEITEDSINILFIANVDTMGYITDSYLYNINNSFFPLSKYILYSHKKIKFQDKMNIRDFDFHTTKRNSPYSEYMLRQGFIYYKKK